jgi:hypothetical protein
MKHIIPLVPCLLALLAGCGGKSAATAAEQQRAANVSRLELTTPEVQRAFLRQFPNAAITDVQPQPTGTGLTLYKIVFIDRGKPGNAVYHSDGTLLRSPTAGRAPATP